MKIICDTNIWYNIGNEKIDASFLKPDDILVATISMLELAITENNANIPEYTKRAIQSMIKYSGKSIVIDPPIQYIIKLSNPSYQYDKNFIDSLLQFTERIANGESIEPSKMHLYKSICSEQKNSLLSLTEYTNTKAMEIKQKNKNKRLSNDTISSCKQLISELFFLHSNEEIPLNFDWQQLKLFITLFDAFLKKVETGAKIVKTNDWFDLFQCIYVQPGMKFWTRETYWKNLIKEIGMEHYLFEN